MLQVFRNKFGQVAAAVILGLIAISFIFFGINFSTTIASYAAKVNGEEIPLQEFRNELQAAENQYQQLYQIELDDELDRQIRRSVIERMVQAEALRQRVEDLGYRASDERLSESIRSIEAFQAGGQFSMQVYRALLANQGLSVAGFEAAQRDQLALQDLQAGIGISSFVTPAELRRHIELANERRNLAYAMFSVEAFTEGVDVTDEDVQKYYDENGGLYMSDESVDFDYVELSLSDIAAGIQISEEDLRQYYEDNREQYEKPEERRASHILVEIDEDEGGREAAEAEVEEIMGKLDAGESFADLAAEYSDDAGTVNQGGDLGWIARGTLPEAFEDALYSIDEVGGIAGPVETDAGLHIIRLDDLREGEVQPFDEVRDEIRDELSTQRAEDQFYDRANRLADLAFDAFDELASVSKELDLPIKSVEGFTRSGGQGLFDENRAAVVEAAFDPENVNSGTNSDLIELADDHVMVLRVTAHHDPEQLPLEEVSGEIRDELTHERASARAGEALDAYVEAVDGGADRETAAAEHGGEWHAPAWIERDNAELPSQVVSVAFSLPEPMDMPERERVMLSGGDEAEVFIDDVEPGDPERLSTEEREMLRNQLMQEYAQAELEAYVTTVRREAKVSIPDQTLEPQF